MRIAFSLLLLIGFTTFIGCNDDESGETTPGFDRQQMLTDLADNVIIPAYDALDGATTGLNAAIIAFTDNPTEENLTAARTAFKSAWLIWQKSAFWDFGPAFDVSLMGSLNTFPTDFIAVENDIEAGTTPGDDLGSLDKKGFPAIDYLLYGGGSDADVVALYTTDNHAANRKAYLKAITEDIASRVATVAGAWSASG
ncbi:MAG: imelysin family protein, partial [Fulvivirga sp.]|nr:imelysin family protein [Fulvivirga sp.]